MTNELKAGDIVYILEKYTPDGNIKIVEVEIQKTWKNGKVLAYTTKNEPGEWKFTKRDFNQPVFRTREEANAVQELIKARLRCFPYT
jgi:hypothetical protein